MTETFNFDFYQIPQTGVEEPDRETEVRTTAGIPIRRALDMKLSTFGSNFVEIRNSLDYTTLTKGFKSAGELYDIGQITEDTGMGQNVRLFGVTVNHNPYLLGSTVKWTRDDQFIRMTMSKNTGSSTEATQVDPPMFDVMDTKRATAEGILATTNYGTKNWPTEGWSSFGKKGDFVPNKVKGFA